jgi:hypothetical protein
MAKASAAASDSKSDPKKTKEKTIPPLFKPKLAVTSTRCRGMGKCIVCVGCGKCVCASLADNVTCFSCNAGYCPPCHFFSTRTCPGCDHTFCDNKKCLFKDTDRCHHCAQRIEDPTASMRIVMKDAEDHDTSLMSLLIVSEPETKGGAHWFAKVRRKDIPSQIVDLCKKGSANLIRGSGAWTMAKEFVEPYRPSPFDVTNPFDPTSYLNVRFEEVLSLSFILSAPPRAASGAGLSPAASTN